MLNQDQTRPQYIESSSLKRHVGRVSRNNYMVSNTINSTRPIRQKINKDELVCKMRFKTKIINKINFIYAFYLVPLRDKAAIINIFVINHIASL